MIVRELLTEFGVRYDDEGARAADRSINGLIRNGQALLTVFAGSFVVRGLKDFVTDLVEAGDSAAKTATKLGLTAEELQEMRFAAQLTGVKVTALDMGMQRFTRRLAEARKGQGEAKDALKDYGIQLTDSNGVARRAVDVLGDVADAMSATEDQGERVRLAFKLFDSEGVAMINTLQGGREEFERMRQQARDTGGIIGSELARDAEKAADAMLVFDFTMQGLRNTLGAIVLPFITRAIDSFSGWLKSVRRLVEGSKLLEATMLVLGAIGAAAAATFLAPWLPAIARFAAITLVVGGLILVLDELLVLFDGGETLIGEFLDTMGGLGTAQLFVDSVRTGWQLMGEAIDDAIDTVMEWGATVHRWVESAGQAVDRLADRFTIVRKIVDGLRSLFGGDQDLVTQSIKGFFDSETFRDQRTRRRSADRGVSARLLAGPDFGVANAERPGEERPPGAHRQISVQAQQAVANAQQILGGHTVNVQGGDVVINGNADRGTVEDVRRVVRDEMDRVGRSAMDSLKGTRN